MASPSTLCFQFPAATGSNIVGGSAHLALTNKILPHADVLILSDTNHSLSVDMYADALSAEKVLNFAKSGVTDIFIETIVSTQPMINALANEDIEKDEYIAANLGTISALTPEQELKQLGDEADMIIAASKEGLTVHAAQLGNTDEQNAQIDALMIEAGDKFDSATNLVDQFISDLTDKGLVLEEDDINNLWNLADDFVFDAEDYNGNFLSKAYGITNDLLERYPDARMELLSFSQEIVSLKSEQLSIEDQAFNLNSDFRIDNDPRLAKMIDDKAQGRAIVVLGSDHGAERANDLDENLADLGKSVARVNMVYNDGQIPSIAQNNDPAEFDYYLADDRLEINDHNGDGCIEGAPAPIALDHTQKLSVGISLPP